MTAERPGLTVIPGNGHEAGFAYLMAERARLPEEIKNRIVDRVLACCIASDMLASNATTRPDLIKLIAALWAEGNAAIAWLAATGLASTGRDGPALAVAPSCGRGADNLEEGAGHDAGKS